MALNFAPFQLRPAPTLPSHWLPWLAAAVTGRPEPPPDRSPAAWAAALPAIEAHGLAPLLYTHLKATPAAGGMAGEPFERLEAAFRASATRALRMELALAQIVIALTRNGVPCLLLKGAALGRTVYGNPAERPVNDLDLLVPRKALAAAQSALAGIGYIPHSPSAAGRMGCWLYRYKAEAVAVGRRADNRGLLVETHWTLTELPYYIDRIEIAAAWRTARPTAGLEPAQLPDPAVLLIHACAHLALHHACDLRLIWLVDLDRLARQAALDWSRVIALTAAWGLGLAVDASLTAADRWLGTPIPLEVRQELSRLAAEPAGRAMWGLGDERLAGRWWRRPAATWAVFDTRQRARYAAWLATRLAYRLAVWRDRPQTVDGW